MPSNLLPTIITLFGVLLVIALLSLTVKVIPQAHAYVIERLGAYSHTLHKGLHLIFPIIDRVALDVPLKEQVYDFQPQPVITKDNVTMMIDTIVFFQILDPKLFAYGVASPIKAIEALTATTLRNIIGELELDETLTSREVINSKMRVILDEATDPWGIKVNRVELKNILPPKDIQEAMEKQMRAERDRRAIILESEGEKRAAILKAEGEQESAILRARGKADSQIIQAQAEATARLQIAQAEAQALEILQKTNPSSNPMSYLIAREYIQTLPKIMEDKQGKVILVPYEASSLVSSLATIKTLFQEVQ